MHHSQSQPHQQHQHRFSTDPSTQQPTSHSNTRSSIIGTAAAAVTTTPQLLLSPPPKQQFHRKRDSTSNFQWNSQFQDSMKNLLDDFQDESALSSSDQRRSLKHSDDYSIRSPNLLLQGPRSMVASQMGPAFNLSKRSSLPGLSLKSVQQINQPPFDEKAQYQLKQPSTPHQHSSQNRLSTNSLMISIPMTSPKKKQTQVTLTQPTSSKGSSTQKTHQLQQHSFTHSKQQSNPSLTPTIMVQSPLQLPTDLLPQQQTAQLPQQPVKNIYTNNDTRFEEMMKLNSTNSKLKQCLDEMKDKLDEMDEFKIALAHSHMDKTEDINQLRTDLLKAQIARQQRHIRSLTGLLKSSRKAMKEVLSVTNFLAQLVTRHESSTSSNHNSHSSQKKEGTITKLQPETSPSIISQPDGSNNQTPVDQADRSQPNQAAVAPVSGENSWSLPSSEAGIIAVLDGKLSHLSLKNLLNNLGRLEEKDTFVATFSAAYSKIVEYERPQKEFSKLFSITNYKASSHHHHETTGNNTTTKKSVVKYNSPVKDFMTKYGGFFPVNTIFSSFPSQSKETFYNMLSIVQALLRKCDKGFKEVKTFSLFRSNPFLYLDAKNKIDLPESLVANSSNFEEYLTFRNQMRTINLSHEQICKTEAHLTTLLNSLLAVYQDTLLQNKTVTISEDASQLITSLRASIEQLISLGIMLNPDRVQNNSRYQVVALDINKEFSLSQMPDLNELSQPQPLMAQSKIVQLPGGLALADDSLNESQIHQSSSMRSIKLSQKRQQDAKLRQKFEEELRDSEKLRVLRLEKDAECTTDFFDKHAICQSLFDDLNRSLYSSKSHEEARKIARRLGVMLFQLKRSFEMKNNILLLRDTQIQFLKHQLLVYKHDIAACSSFFAEVDSEIRRFFTPIHEKLHSILSLFNSVVVDGSKAIDPKMKKTLILTFKRNLKEVLELIKKVQDRNAPINSIDIQNIADSFEQLVVLATRRHDHAKNDKGTVSNHHIYKQTQ